MRRYKYSKAAGAGLTRLLGCLLAALTLVSFAGCQNTQPNQTPAVPGDGLETEAAPATEAQEPATEADPETTAAEPLQQGDGIGLRNVKIDMPEVELTEDQKAVRQYFDQDYLNVPDYEFLRRYPSVFNGAQVFIWGSIEKIVSMDQDRYTALLLVNVGKYEQENGIPTAQQDDYVLITGETGEAWYMEGDVLQIYGRDLGIETVEIDGTSYTIPSVTVHYSYVDTSDAPSWVYHFVPKFSDKYIKKVAKAIFGDDIELRRPIDGVDIPAEMMGLWDPEAYLIAELENQSNSKFQKFRFSTEMGEIVVADEVSSDRSMERYVEFSADFSRFYMVSYNKGLDTLTLECYDAALNKLWKREFEDAYYGYDAFYYAGVYDYTKENVYLIVNNELYVINTETGENAQDPVYVGSKIAIRKMEDGVLLISGSKADGIMKYDLDGNILWKTTLPTDITTLNGIQFVENKIVVQAYFWEMDADNCGTHFYVLDMQTGELLTDAVSLSS